MVHVCFADGPCAQRSQAAKSPTVLLRNGTDTPRAKDLSSLFALVVPQTRQATRALNAELRMEG